MLVYIYIVFINKHSYIVLRLTTPSLMEYYPSVWKALRKYETMAQGHLQGFVEPWRRWSGTSQPLPCRPRSAVLDLIQLQCVSKSMSSVLAQRCIS